MHGSSQQLNSLDRSATVSAVCWLCSLLSNTNLIQKHTCILSCPRAAFPSHPLSLLMKLCPFLVVGLWSPKYSPFSLQLHSYINPTLNTDSIFAMSSSSVMMWSLFFVFVCHRYLLHPVIRHHHAKHKPPQPKCEGQANRGAIHLHEQRNQRWRRFTWRSTPSLYNFQLPELSAKSPTHSLFMVNFICYRICMRALRMSLLRSQRMMAMTSHTLSSTQTERAGY